MVRCSKSRAPFKNRLRSLLEARHPNADAITPKGTLKSLEESYNSVDKRREQARDHQLH